ncbi:class I SAM-dependent RNA methyltransferase [Parvularcula flava]|uniref:Class I SAM-dependent RNA methyltransferase n=1 Tax=Aquisalinus luteolus TaxID=1566827 RepID=A0A8J3ERS9_9PROT|nr:class I SAM-dependent RNA methyltransferase [Aquisalinus luteolus]NHK28983.1 class I SAM-dependent RNA methyltransferase [Aquisalinus luteolus]GGI00666.1 putative RNA methyltransferase [Aquisalinus luteolus]
MPGRRFKRKPAKAPKPFAAEAEIVSIGLQGDGTAIVGDRTVHVPFAAPGDVAQLSVTGTKAQLTGLSKESAVRKAPVCRHFGHARDGGPNNEKLGDECGGCALQHLDTDYYNAWKQGLIRQALSREGLSHVEVLPLLSSSPKMRRRAGYSVRWIGGKAQIGFLAKGSHRLVPMAECHVLDPELFALRDDVARLCEPLFRLNPKAWFTCFVTLADSGADVDLGGDVAEEDLDLAAREALTELARAMKLSRLTLNRVPLYVPGPVTVTFAGTPVPLPPKGFLQATKDGEEALQRVVLDGVGEASHVADLFSGSGTFTFAMAKRANVHAVESVPEAIAAINVGRNQAGLKPITTQVRDLFRQPLMPDELKSFEAVVFDPPRAGAEAQVEQLAGSAVPVIVGVSCSPKTFARDAAILTAGGYRLDAVQPVDQFIWSPHIEVAAVFRR